jgi:hypothetical protein
MYQTDFATFLKYLDIEIVNRSFKFSLRYADATNQGNILKFIHLKFKYYSLLNDCCKIKVYKDSK